MRTIRFTLNKNLKQEFNNHRLMNGLNLLNAFTIKSDILDSSFLYEFETHDSIKDSKKNITKMIKHFNVEHINWSINNLLIQQHNIIINDSKSHFVTIQQKNNKQ